jgi:putative ABC transport system permease protein
MSNGARQSVTNRKSLFWRLWLRSLVVRRPQAAVAVVSLLAGAAVASMLLNLYGDVQRKMTQEFRAYGANVLVSPPAGQSAKGDVTQGLMDESALERLEPLRPGTGGFVAAPMLFLVGRVSRVPADPRLPAFENAVVAGANLQSLRSVVGMWRETAPAGGAELDEHGCIAGVHLAGRLHLAPGSEVQLTIDRPGASSQSNEAAGVFRVGDIVTTGTSADDQIFVSLPALQSLAGLEGKISLIEAVVPGGTRDIERRVREMRAALPGLDVRPIRQIVYSQAKVLGTIRWLLITLTALIVLIIALCVAATMTAIVLERRKDIAVMKALGAGNRTVGRLFLAEGASLGILAGLAGFPLGVLLASELTRRLFGVSLSVVWWALPVVCAATVLVAVLATTFPVDIIRRVQPATILKGE